MATTVMSTFARTATSLSIALLGAAPVHASPPPAAAEVTTPNPSPCPPATDPSALKEIERRIDVFRRQAEEAYTARDWQQAADLLLRVEHNLPVDKLRSRASALRQAFSILHEAAQAGAQVSAPLERARAAAEGFLADAQVILGDAAASRSEITDVRADLDRARALAPSVDPSTPPTPKPEGPIALPKVRDTPTGAELAAQRRQRALTAGLAAAGTATALSLIAGTSLAIASRPNGTIGRNIVYYAQRDSDYVVNDVCHVVDQEISNMLQPNAEIAAWCGQFTAVNHAETAMWVTTGAFALATAVLSGLLAKQRMAPRKQARLRLRGLSSAMLRIDF